MESSGGPPTPPATPGFPRHSQVPESDHADHPHHNEFIDAIMSQARFQSNGCGLSMARDHRGNLLLSGRDRPLLAHCWVERYEPVKNYLLTGAAPNQGCVVGFTDESSGAAMIRVKFEPDPSTRRSGYEHLFPVYAWTCNHTHDGTPLQGDRPPEEEMPAQPEADVAQSSESHDVRFKQAQAEASSKFVDAQRHELAAQANLYNTQLDNVAKHTELGKARHAGGGALQPMGAPAVRFQAPAWTAAERAESCASQQCAHSDHQRVLAIQQGASPQPRFQATTTGARAPAGSEAKGNNKMRLPEYAHAR